MNLKDYRFWKWSALCLMVTILVVWPTMNALSKTQVLVGDTQKCTECGTTYSKQVRKITVWKADASDYSVTKGIGLCDRCGNKLVNVQEGKKVVCPNCKKTDESDVRTTKVKLKDKNKHGVATLSVVCPICQQKATEAANQKAQKDAWKKSVSEYSSQVAKISSDVSEGLYGITTFAQKWPQVTETDIFKVAANTVVLEQNYIIACALTPPAGMEEIHGHFLAGLKSYSDAMTPFRQGIDTLDASLINEAANLMDSGTAEIGKTKELIDAFVASNSIK